MDQAQVQNYISQLNPVYEPQKALIQQQMAALPASYEAQKSALEQAKVNAFRDIQNVAQQRGVSFSGFTPSEQASYTGTKYLPALAGLAQQQSSRENQLQQVLNTLNANQYNQGMSNYASTLKAANDYAVAMAKAKTSTAKTATPKAQSIGQIKASAAADARQLFTEAKGKASEGYTESSVIPQLQTLYPELSAQQIYDLVYPARQIVWGS